MNAAITQNHDRNFLFEDPPIHINLNPEGIINIMRPFYSGVPQ
jgi:hypothetical protein